MSFDYRFEPPTTAELEEMGAYFECPYDFKCETCEYDCDLEAEP